MERRTFKQFRLSLLMTLVCVACGARLVAASALTFNLPYGQRKCFMEELPPAATVRGTLHVSSGRGDMSLDMFVSDSRGTVHFHKSDVNSIKFSFHTPTSHRNDGHYVDGIPETYRFCVVNQVHPQAATSPGVTRRVTLDVSYMSNRHSDEVEKLAKQDHVEKIFSTFSSVSADVDSLIERLDDLRARERQLSELNENTAYTILTISLLASIFTILTGMLNFLSLKSFFKRKKLA